MDWTLQRRLVEEDQAMQMTLSATEWDELERAQQHEHVVRNWKRYQAIRLLGQGQSPLEVATALRCRKSSVYNWIGVWKQRGVRGCMKDITAVGSDGCRPRARGAASSAGNRSARPGRTGHGLDGALTADAPEPGEL
jgi:hypothetical protein